MSLEESLGEKISAFSIRKHDDDTILYLETFFIGGSAH